MTLNWFVWAVWKSAAVAKARGISSASESQSFVSLLLKDFGKLLYDEDDIKKEPTLLSQKVARSLKNVKKSGKDDYMQRKFVLGLLERLTKRQGVWSTRTCKILTQVKHYRIVAPDEQAGCTLGVTVTEFKRNVKYDAINEKCVTNKPKVMLWGWVGVARNKSLLHSLLNRKRFWWTFVFVIHQLSTVFRLLSNSVGWVRIKNLFQVLVLPRSIYYYHSPKNVSNIFIRYFNHRIDFQEIFSVKT